MLHIHTCTYICRSIPLRPSRSINYATVHNLGLSATLYGGSNWQLRGTAKPYNYSHDIWFPTLWYNNFIMRLLLPTRTVKLLFQFIFYVKYFDRTKLIEFYNVKYYEVASNMNSKDISKNNKLYMLQKKKSV